MCRVTAEFLRRDAATLIRYLLVGGTTAFVYLGMTALLVKGAAMPVQAGVAISYAVAVTIYFVLQRSFVFAREEKFALALRAQLRRFVIVCILQYVATAALVAAFTSAGLPDFGAVVAAAAIVAPSMFVILRTKLFHGVGDPG